MAKADLHVHSKYSEHPSEWFLQRLGAKESYTEPEHIFQSARARGMDFVTITDHNRVEGSLLIAQKYPAEAFSGAEFTTYFPEDGCKVHLLVYGLDHDEFEEIQRIRSDIYQLRDFLVGRSLPHSVAHATYQVNGMTGLPHLEKLLLLFDVFEGTNGGRNQANNSTWTEVLDGLDRGRIEALRQRHGICPVSSDPWIKGRTGGSDDHAGLFIGQTCTMAEASSPAEFLDAIRRRRTRPSGRSNNYQSLVFAVYRIAWEFSRQRSSGASRSFFSALTEFVFEKKEFRLKERLFLKRLSSGGSRANLYRIVNDLVTDVRRNRDEPVERRLDILYERIADLADEFMKSLVKAIKKDVVDGDLVGFVANASASIPGVFLSVPFFTAVRDMFANRSLLDSVRMKLAPSAHVARRRRVMWFTDTFTDLNGVSVTLDKISRMAETADPGVRIVTALSPGEGSGRANVLELPFIESFSLPGYERYNLKVPSVLKALDLVARYEPDAIYISTPGPVGLTGLLVARLMSVRATGFFHTDYARQATRIVGDESVQEIIEGYIRWFYGCCEEVRVPTCEYMSILGARGYDPRRMLRFNRGIDTTEFAPDDEVRAKRRAAGAGGGAPVLVYTGRISREKNLDIAVAAYTSLLEEMPGARLLLAGDGPFLEELRGLTRNIDGIRFLGRIPNRDLPALYSSADLFLFPSDTDTFGMSVLEAQACGLPAVVSSIGGPKEIIEDGVTGFVARSCDRADWISKIRRVAGMMHADPAAYEEMRSNARARVLAHFDWGKVYDGLFAPPLQEPAIRPGRSTADGGADAPVLAGAGI